MSVSQVSGAGTSVPPAAGDVAPTGDAGAADAFGTLLASALHVTGRGQAACGSPATTAGPEGSAVPVSDGGDGDGDRAATEQPESAVAEGAALAAPVAALVTLPGTVPGSAAAKRAASSESTAAGLTRAGDAAEAAAATTRPGSTEGTAAPGAAGAGVTGAGVTAPSGDVRTTGGDVPTTAGSVTAATDGAGRGTAHAAGPVHTGGAATGAPGDGVPSGAPQVSASSDGPGQVPAVAPQPVDGLSLVTRTDATPPGAGQQTAPVEGSLLATVGTGSAAGPATGAAASAPTPAQNPPAVTAQVFPAVARLVTREEGTQRLTIRLHPEDLGEVRVVVTVRHGAVTVDLAASAAAQEALRHGAGDLRRLLDGAGAASTHVSFRDLPQTATQPVAAGAGSTGPQVDVGNTGAGGHGRETGAGNGADGRAPGDGRGGAGPASARAAPIEPNLQQPTSSTAAGAYRGPGVDLRM